MRVTAGLGSVRKLAFAALCCASMASGSAARAADATPRDEARHDVRIDIAVGTALTDGRDTPATPMDENFFGEPAAVGIHVAMWRSWFGMELWTGYQYDLHRWQALIGPVARYRRHPCSVALGVGAGWATLGGLNWHSGGESRFAVSPHGAVELELGEHWFVGGRYAFDVPLHAAGRARTQRILLTQGWRF